LRAVLVVAVELELITPLVVVVAGLVVAGVALTPAPATTWEMAEQAEATL
jgi:hypothetical protein